MHIRKVLVLRPDNLGDVVLFSGALRQIRAHYPGAEITLCVKRYTGSYWEQCPHIDRLVYWEDVVSNLTARPTLDWLPEVRGRWRLQNGLRFVTRKVLRQCYRTDLLLLPVRSPTSLMHIIVNTIPAKSRFGIAGDFCNQSAQDDRAAEYIYSERLHLSSKRRNDHELLVTRDFLRLLGMEVDVDDLWPEFWTGFSVQEWAVEAIPRHDGIVTLAVCPGVTSLPGKFYPGENYASILTACVEMRFAVTLFGSTAEKPQCTEVAQVLTNCENVVSVTNLAGNSTVRQLIEGLKRCDAVLAQETAALHIAVALRKPTVGILGGGHFGRFYPWGDPLLNRTAQQTMDCYGCNWNCLYSSIRCIQEISPYAIAEELKAALSFPLRKN